VSLYQVFEMSSKNDKGNLLPGGGVVGIKKFHPINRTQKSFLRERWKNSAPETGLVLGRKKSAASSPRTWGGAPGRGPFGGPQRGADKSRVVPVEEGNPLNRIVARSG